MKKVLVFLCGITLLLSLSSVAYAVPVSVTFTADNVVNAWIQNGGDPISWDLIAGPDNGYDDWRDADTLELDLEVFHEYQIIFEVVNTGLPSLDNPAGFLAEISSSTPIDTGSLLSSSAWYVTEYSAGVTDFDLLDWDPTYEVAANNDSSSIWYKVNKLPDGTSAPGPIADIDDTAYWIWTNYTEGIPDEDHIFIKIDLTPVPEPATFLLLGAGLFASLSRKFFLK